MGDPLNPIAFHRDWCNVKGPMAVSSMLMHKPCEICGDIGYVDATLICSKCTLTREHVYCMSEMYKGDREEWICDECNVSKKQPSSKPGLHFSLKKPPQNTKMQYIPPEEVRSLASGAMKNNLSSPRKSFIAHRTPVNKPFVPKMKANSSSSAMHSNLCTKPNPQIVPSGRSEPLNKRSMATSFRDKKLSALIEKEDSVIYCQHSPVDKQQSLAGAFQKSNGFRKETNGSGRQHHGESPPFKRVTFQESPKLDAKSKNVELESTPRESVHCLAATNSDKCAQQVCRDTPTANCLPMEKLSEDDINTVHTQSVQSFPTGSVGIGVCGTQPKIMDSKGRESPKVNLVFDSYLPNHPAVSPTWRGTLNILNDVLPCSSFDEIQAFHPCKINYKAFEFAKQLPKTLYYELLPRRNAWVNIFKEKDPVELDISLYFFHATTSNLNGDYCSLLEYLDVHDLFLRTCVDGVELFVFSSKHLPETSQKINQKHYLWGLFRPFPRRQAQQSQQSISEELEAEEMDVDMLGGFEVGKVDIIIPKQKDDACGDYFEGEKVSSREIKASPMSTAGLVVDFSPVKIEREWTDDIGCTTSSVDAEEEFNKELQSCFDKFTALIQLKDARCLKTDIKQEVNA